MRNIYMFELNFHMYIVFYELGRFDTANSPKQTQKDLMYIKSMKSRLLSFYGIGEVYEH